MNDVLSELWGYVAALLPSIGLVFLFVVIVRHMIEGDRRERAAQRALDREAARRGAEKHSSEEVTSADD